MPAVIPIPPFQKEEPEVKWVRRKNANVDRIACPWLIRRFVDQDPEFIYVPAGEVKAVAEREGAIPCDVKDVGLGHVNGRCSFESIMVKYNLDDPALQLLAKIVQGEDDHEKIRLETPMYDALYAWCQSQVAQTG
jgi:hypothetical protein